MSLLRNLTTSFLLTFDWITGLTPTSRIENMNNILKEINDINKSSVDKLLNSEVFKTNVNDLLAILKENIYGRMFAEYILYKLGYFYGATDRINVPNIISAEHILPQNPDENSQWKQDFDEIQRLFWTNKIGNLVLISRRKNSSQGRLDFQRKQEKYFKNNIELFRNSVRVFNTYREWKPLNVEENNRTVLEKIENHYKMNQ